MKKEFHNLSLKVWKQEEFTPNIVIFGFFDFIISAFPLTEFTTLIKKLNEEKETWCFRVVLFFRETLIKLRNKVNLVIMAIKTKV